MVEKLIYDEVVIEGETFVCLGEGQGWTRATNKMLTGHCDRLQKDLDESNERLAGILARLEALIKETQNEKR